MFDCDDDDVVMSMGVLPVPALLCECWRREGGGEDDGEAVDRDDDVTTILPRWRCSRRRHHTQNIVMTMVTPTMVQSVLRAASSPRWPAPTPLPLLLLEGKVG